MRLDEVQDEIAEEFAGLGDWFDVYERLVALGRDLAAGAEDLRTEANRVAGCQSRVWIRAAVDNGAMSYQADSDSMITAGMISLLLRVLNERRPEEIVAADLHFVKDIGLTSNLSPSRANGLALIIKRMKALASNAIR